MGDNGNIPDPLETLIASGTVRGTCLLNNGEVVYEKFPYSAARLVKVCRVVEGLTKEFNAQGRSVDQMAFGYEGGNLLAVTVKHYRVIIMHLMNDEIDFLAKIARAHLEDIIADEKPAEEEEVSESDLMRGAVSIDTVPIKVAKERQVYPAVRVEETTRVAVLAAPSVPVAAPSVPVAAPPVPVANAPDADTEDLSSDNISLGI